MWRSASVSERCPSTKRSRRNGRTATRGPMNSIGDRYFSTERICMFSSAVVKSQDVTFPLQSTNSMPLNLGMKKLDLIISFTEKSYWHIIVLLLRCNFKIWFPNWKEETIDSPSEHFSTVCNPLRCPRGHLHPVDMRLYPDDPRVLSYRCVSITLWCNHRHEVGMAHNLGWTSRLQWGIRYLIQSVAACTIEGEGRTNGLP